MQWYTCVGIDGTTSSEAAGVGLGLCDEEVVCPVGSRAQGLSSCDPLTHNCVCQVGFQLDNGVCVGMLSPIVLSIITNSKKLSCYCDSRSYCVGLLAILHFCEIL